MNPARPSIDKSLSRVAFAAAFALAAAAPAVEDAPPSWSVTVLAGPHARLDAPVVAPLPAEFAGVAAVDLIEITGAGPRRVPVQIDTIDGSIRWIVAGRTVAGGERAYRLSAAPAAPAAPDAAAAPAAEAPDALALRDVDGRHFEITRGGRPVLRYNYGMVPPPDPATPAVQTRNAYIHPVWTPAGRVVSNDYPPNHLHHRGIWFPWTKTEFEGRQPDFWNLGAGLGTVRFVWAEETWAGPVHAGFRVRHHHLDLKAPKGPKAALRETWDVRVFGVGAGERPYFLFDLVSTQRCAGPSPLILPEYHYGGLGYRGPWDWEGKNVEFLTSEGKTREDGHGTRSRWCSISGKVGGEKAGIVIFCHPQNFRFPQNMRIHPNEPFFCYAPEQLGDMAIRPGETYISRYRFLLHDGSADVEEIERLWRDYGEPPAVVMRKME